MAKRKKNLVTVTYDGDGPGCASEIRVTGRTWRRGEEQDLPEAEAETYRGRPGFTVAQLAAGNGGE